MKIKLVGFILSLLFLLGFAGTNYAADDFKYPIMPADVGIEAIKAAGSPPCGYDFKAGDYFIWQAENNQMRIDVERCNGSVNGYTALRFINRQDPYGGGSYYADVPGICWAQIGSDVHDAFSMDYLGISDYTPPLPLFLLDYGVQVGTAAEWIGYNVLEDEDVEGYDKIVWEVLAYEDITVPYGHFQNAMKVFRREYYTWYYDDPENIPEEDWEFSESCSGYIWIVPTVGVVKRLGYEDSVPMELVSCKINGQVNPDGGNECTVDADCDNGAFCDGEETCVAGACVDGPGDPCEVGETCDEASDQCFPEGEDEWDLNGDGDVDKEDSKLLKLQQKVEKTDLKVQHTAEKNAMKAAIGSTVDCGTGWDLDEDCDVDKDDAKLLKLRQKDEKTDLKIEQKAEKEAMKAAL